VFDDRPRIVLPLWSPYSIPEVELVEGLQRLQSTVTAIIRLFDVVAVLVTSYYFSPNIIADNASHTHQRQVMPL